MFFDKEISLPVQKIGGYAIGIITVHAPGLHNVHKLASPGTWPVGPGPTPSAPKEMNCSVHIKSCQRDIATDELRKSREKFFESAAI